MIQDKTSVPENFEERHLACDTSLFEFRRGLIQIIVFAAVLYISLATCWPKFSRAEVFFAECAREMLVIHNFITPFYHNEPFFDKPILSYWAVIAMFKVFGLNHWAARLPSIISALATISIVGIGTAKIFGRIIGLMACAMLASSFMFLHFASLCMSDMMLVFFDTATLSLAFAGIKIADKRTPLWSLASVSAGLAFLTKGPIGIVLPAISFIIYLAATKRFSIIKEQHIWRAFAIPLLISLPWFCTVFFSNGPHAISYFFIHENLQRFTGGVYDANRPFWYTIVSFFVGFAPWSILVPFAFIDEIRTYKVHGFDDNFQTRLYLWIWIAVVIGFFSLSKGKCDYYVLPAFPAAAALSALYLETEIQEGQKIARVLLSVYAGLLLAAGILLPWILQQIVGTGDVLRWASIPVLLIICAAVVWNYAGNSMLTRSVFAVAISVCIVAVMFALTILPIFGQLEPTDKIAKLIDTHPEINRIVLDKTLYSWRDELTFQTGKHPILISKIDELADMLRESEPLLYISTGDKLDELDKTSRSKLSILSKERAITHSLTPGFVLQQKGKLLNPIPVVVAIHE